MGKFVRNLLVLIIFLLNGCATTNTTDLKETEANLDKCRSDLAEKYLSNIIEDAKHNQQKKALVHLAKLDDKIILGYKTLLYDIMQTYSSKNMDKLMNSILKTFVSAEKLERLESRRNNLLNQ